MFVFNRHENITLISSLFSVFLNLNFLSDQRLQPVISKTEEIAFSGTFRSVVFIYF